MSVYILGNSGPQWSGSFRVLWSTKEWIGYFDIHYSEESLSVMSDCVPFSMLYLFALNSCVNINHINVLFERHRMYGGYN